MAKQIISIEVSNENPQAGEQITVDVFHEVQRESNETGASKLSLSLFFNDKDLILDSIDYPNKTLGFDTSFPLLFTLPDNSNLDNIEETKAYSSLAFKSASPASPYPDEKTKIATATFTVLEGFDGSEIAVKIPQPTSVTYPPETLDPITTTLSVEAENSAPELTGNPATLVEATEDTNYEINASDLLAGFTDADGDDLSITDLEASSGELINNNDGTWTFTPEADSNVAVELTYNVTDGNEGVTPATQSFTVEPVDDAPVVREQLADLVVDENAENTIIDMSNTFGDIDNDDADITKTIAVNDNPGLVSSEINGDFLTLYYRENSSGNAKITVQGESNGKTVTDIFGIQVKNVDTAPTVKQQIFDLGVDEDAENTVIDLSNTFDDIDNDNAAIIKTIAINDNPELVSAEINGNSLVLDYLENRSGRAIITVQGESNGKTVTNVFTVDVDPVDDAPFVKEQIADLVVDEDAENTVIDLSNTFGDIDIKARNVERIIKTVASNDNPELVDAQIDGDSDSLIIDYLENRSGIARITVQGESNGKAVRDVFAIDVKPVDDAPFIQEQIDDLIVDENAENTVVDLSNTFSDIDNDDAAIVKTITVNDNPELVDAEINGDLLTLDYLENRSGIAKITVQGESNGKTVTDVFAIDVEENIETPDVSEPEEPAVETPDVSEPEEPAVETPDVSEPEEPAVETPDVSEPEEPAVETPDVVEPEEPAVETPDVSEPEEPAVETPDVSEPEEPVVETPDVVEPEEPVVETPDVSEEFSLQPLEIQRYFNAETGIHSYSENNNNDNEGESETVSYRVLESNLDSVTGEEIPGVKAVYEFFNTDTDVSLYTMDSNEQDYILNNLDNYEAKGIAYYGFESEPVGIDTIPVYRMLNTQTDTHMYTADQAEVDYIQSNLDHFDLENKGEAVFYALEV